MRYRQVKVREEVFEVFRKRAKGTGLSYTDFLRKLLTEDEKRKTRELRELFSYLTSIDEKLDFLIMNLGNKESVSGSVTLNQLNHDVIFDGLLALGETLIILPARREEFKKLVEECRKKGEKGIYEVVLELVRIFVVGQQKTQIEDKLKKIIGEE